MADNRPTASLGPFDRASRAGGRPGNHVISVQIGGCGLRSRFSTDDRVANLAIGRQVIVETERGVSLLNDVKCAIRDTLAPDDMDVIGRSPVCHVRSGAMESEDLQHPMTSETHARVMRLLRASSTYDPDELLRRIVSMERESAALLLRCAGRADAYEWTHLGTAGDRAWSELRPEAVLLEDVVRRRVPAMRRVSLSGSVKQGDALVVPVEAAEGAPLGVLIVLRKRRFRHEDVDFYRLVGLRISDWLPGPAG